MSSNPPTSLLRRNRYIEIKKWRNNNLVLCCKFKGTFSDDLGCRLVKHSKTLFRGKTVEQATKDSTPRPHPHPPCPFESAWLSQNLNLDSFSHFLWTQNGPRKCGPWSERRTRDEKNRDSNPWSLGERAVCYPSPNAAQCRGYWCETCIELMGTGSF